MVIATVFGGVAGDNAEDLLENYNMGNYRIVVEAVYWWRPVYWEGWTFRKNGSEVWIYGTIQELAGADDELRYIISKEGKDGGGPNLGNYSNTTLALALCLDDTDTGFSGWKAP